MENIQLTQPLMYMYIYVTFEEKKKKTGLLKFCFEALRGLMGKSVCTSHTDWIPEKHNQQIVAAASPCHFISSGQMRFSEKQQNP